MVKKIRADEIAAKPDVEVMGHRYLDIFSLTQSAFSGT